jgi:hypothetical protein
MGCSTTKILTISKVIYNSRKWKPPIKSLPWSVFTLLFSFSQCIKFK